MPPIQKPQGTDDILPVQMPQWNWVLKNHARVAQAHGYRPIQTPVFEDTAMFERGIGAGTDVVDKEMYSFEMHDEKGGSTRLTLRPEGTPATLRAVLSNHLDQDRHPVRVHYAGPMFRHDKPQKGRRRQFNQVGIETIGERAPSLDSEVIEIGWRFFQSLGMSGVSLQLNTLGSLDDRTTYRAALIAYFTPMAESLCEDCRRRLEINPLRLLDCKTDAEAVAGAPQLTDSLSPESTDYFAEVQRRLTDAEIPFTLNPRLVRGLDYYAHTAFEFWHTSLQGAQNALGGGGRYDGLAEVLGFPATPGVGYAIGVERCLLVLEDSDALPGGQPDAEVVVSSIGVAAVAAAADVARRLRGTGHRVVLDDSERRLDKKIRNADRIGATIMVIIGDDEVRDGVAQVRNLEKRQQERVPLGKIEDALAEANAFHNDGRIDL